jgi:hypothetical protein
MGPHILELKAERKRFNDVAIVAKRLSVDQLRHDLSPAAKITKNKPRSSRPLSAFQWPIKAITGHA